MERNIETAEKRDVTSDGKSHFRILLSWIIEQDKQYRVRQSMVDECRKWY